MLRLPRTIRTPQLRLQLPKPPIPQLRSLTQIHHYTTITTPSTPKRSPTSLSNTSRSFTNPEVKSEKTELKIIDEKYSDDGKLLTLDLTPRAISQLNEISKKDDNPDLALRITVESGGCHGFQYNLDLSDIKTKTEDDCIFEKGGARVIIDDSSLSILRESKVDYTTELIGSMFKVVDSPYTSSACGCGSSFDFDFSKI